MDFDHANEEYVYKFSPTVSYASQCFVSNQKIWPSAEQMGLDKSQYEAVKLALENKLALIQGLVLITTFNHNFHNNYYIN